MDYDMLGVMIATNNYDGLVQTVSLTNNDEMVLFMIAEHFSRLIRTENIRNLTRLACIFVRTKYEKEYREICVRIRNITTTYN